MLMKNTEKKTTEQSRGRESSPMEGVGLLREGFQEDLLKLNK